MWVSGEVAERVAVTVTRKVVFITYLPLELELAIPPGTN